MAGLIDNALKKHITPLREEMKKLQKEVLSCESELSSVTCFQVKDSSKKISDLKGQVSLLTVAQKEMTLKLDKASYN